MSPKFSTLRSFIWPIQGSELKKFLPMGLMMFFILFNYTILRNIKDALVITAAGPEILPFLKSFVVLPCSIMFVAFYTKMTNHMTRDRIMYTVISAFLTYFLVFAFYLYPNQEALLPAEDQIQSLQKSYPHFQHIISIYKVWIYSLFYAFAELWNSVVLMLLFWQFANEITRTHEAKRFYTMLAFVGDFALIAAGWLVKSICSYGGFDHGRYLSQGYVTSIVLVISVAGLIVMAIYHWMTQNVLTNPLYYDGAAGVKSGRKKLKLSVIESFKYLMKSRYLWLIAILIIGYGVAMNLAGLMWRKQLELQFPDPLDYSAFLGDFYQYTGTVTVLLIFFLKGIVERFGWLSGAIVTPITLLITCTIFFALLFFDQSMVSLTAMLGIAPLMGAVLIGSAQQVLSKSAKYALFDPTKEMAYIPLDDELKVKGKAAVDVVGYSFSKASGGYVTGILLVLTAASDLMTVAPYLAIVVLAVIILWIGAVFKLNTAYNDLVAQRARPQAPEGQKNSTKVA